LISQSLFVVLPPGSRFCTGSAQGRHLMGLEEDRPANLRFVCSRGRPGGQRPDL